MAVRRLGNGSWQADVTVGRRLDGRPDRRTECHRTRAEAERAERRLLMMRDGAAPCAVSGRISFREFVEDVYWPEKSGLRANTRQGYERDIRRRLMPAFGDMDVERIGRASIQRMLDACPTRKTATNARETLSSILRIAVEMGMIPVNPAGFRYRYPRSRGESRQGEWISSLAEQRRLLAHMEQEHAGDAVERIVVLGLCLGLRKGEILGADWEDVDLAARELRVSRTYTRGKGGSHLTEPKTPAALRAVPLSAHAVRRLRAWGGVGGPIVVGAGGRRMSPETAQKRLRAVVSSETYGDGSPLPIVTTATLRHSFATACANAGMPDTQLAAIMGHRDVSTTKRYYIRQKSAQLHAAIDALDAIP